MRAAAENSLVRVLNPHRGTYIVIHIYIYIYIYIYKQDSNNPQVLIYQKHQPTTQNSNFAHQIHFLWRYSFYGLYFHEALSNRLYLLYFLVLLCGNKNVFDKKKLRCCLNKWTHCSEIIDRGTFSLHISIHFKFTLPFYCRRYLTFIIFSAIPLM